MKSSIGASLRKLLASKPSLHVEIVRMHRKYDVCGNETDDKPGAWKAVGLPQDHVALITMSKKLVEGLVPKQGEPKAKCTVKAAYTDDHGKWKVIEGVEEDVLVPGKDTSAAV
jgi:hypothetical protein